MTEVKPKKQLGQHFLHDKNIAQKIVNLLGDAPVIMEVGAGMGILSSYLQEKYSEKMMYFDIDAESVKYLIEKLPLPAEQVFLEDFLKFDFGKIDKEINIIGNFPYNISSQLFFKILENKDKVNQVVCMIQKEVAQRIAASEGSKNYGILSVLLQTFYNIKYQFTVNENVFIPPPKVKSAVIELKRNTIKSIGCNEKLYIRIIKAAFNQRRKVLSNSLAGIVAKEHIPQKFSTKRPEQLNIKEFIELTCTIEKVI